MEKTLHCSFENAILNPNPIKTKPAIFCCIFQYNLKFFNQLLILEKVNAMQILTIVPEKMNHPPNIKSCNEKLCDEESAN